MLLSIPEDIQFPSYGADPEITDTSNSIKSSEKTLGKPFLANWKANVAAVNPRDYKVADFGVDHDIVATQKNIKDSEANL